MATKTFKELGEEYKESLRREKFRENLLVALLSHREDLNKILNQVHLIKFLLNNNADMSLIKGHIEYLAETLEDKASEANDKFRSAVKEKHDEIAEELGWYEEYVTVSDLRNFQKEALMHEGENDKYWDGRIDAIDVILDGAKRIKKIEGEELFNGNKEN